MYSNVVYNVLGSPITRATFLPKIEMHILSLLIYSKEIPLISMFFSKAQV